MECKHIVENQAKRLSNDIVVKSNLQRNGIIITTGYLVSEEDETREHMIIGCECTKPFWFSVLGAPLELLAASLITEWLVERTESGLDICLWEQRYRIANKLD